jgi:hypothetical protein
MQCTSAIDIEGTERTFMRRVSPRAQRQAFSFDGPGLAKSDIGNATL